jgi:acyl-CoA dehydrogenase
MSERSLLADAVQTFFAARCSPEDVAAIEAGRDSETLWAEMARLGLTLPSVPEHAGGQGGSLVDALTVLRVAGRHAVPLPLAETDLLGGWVLAEAGLHVGEGRLTVGPVTREETLTLHRDGEQTRIDGIVRAVPWASDAEWLVLLAEERGRQYAVRLRPSAAVVTRAVNLAGEARDTVMLDHALVEVGDLALSAVDRESMMLRGALARAALMLGALERVRDLTVAYSRERVQFGRPISEFQAVQHMLAQLVRDVAVVRATLELAVAAASETGVADAWLEIASAKVVAGQAAGTVCAHAHQIHGAIGVTTEYPLTLFTRRLWSWRDEFGSESAWAARIGEALQQSEDGVWAFATRGRLPAQTACTG